MSVEIKPQLPPPTLDRKMASSPSKEAPAKSESLQALEAKKTDIKNHSEAQSKHPQHQEQIHTKSTHTQVSKVAGKVTLTVQDEDGKIIFEHPPKKAIAYQAALDESLQHQAQMRKLNSKV